MDVWGLLAILFAGAFFAFLFVALFYWRLVRPRLMSLAAPPVRAAGEPDARLQDAFRALNESLVKHSALLARLPTSFEVRTGEGAGRLDPETMAALQAAQVEQATALAHLQAEIGGLREALGEAGDTSLDADVAALREQLQAHNTALEGIHGLLSALNNGVLSTSTSLIEQSDTLKSLQQRRDDETLAELRERQASMQNSLAEINTLLTAVSSSALDTSTTVSQQEETLQVLQTRQAQDNAALVNLHEHITETQAGLQGTLEELHMLVSALETNGQARESLAQQRAVLQSVQAEQAELRQLLMQVIEGQQSHSQMLDALGQMEMGVREIIHQEKLVVQDRLQDIKGIGPVFAGLLMEHGVHTFEQLASLTPAELRALVDVPRWRAIDAEGWIEQARLLASIADKAEDAA